MKKSIVVALAMTFMTFMAGWSCFADVTGVADTTKEGSLLIWPLIQTNDGNETYVVISNGDAGGHTPGYENVSIKCYWEVREYPYDNLGEWCPLRDSVFYLSRNNPLIFKASDGTDLDGRGQVPGIGKEKKGMLKCWAVEPTDSAQISWNHLSGYAIIVHDEDDEALTSAWKYSAWRFAANVVRDENGTEFADGFWVGKTVKQGAAVTYNWLKLWGAQKVAKPGRGVTPTCPANSVAIPMGQRSWPASGAATYTYYCVSLVGSQQCDYPFNKKNPCNLLKGNGVYDACPSSLTFEFLAEPNASGERGYAYNHLALAPCKEDLRADEAGEFDFFTRLSYSIWNENEIKYTGSQSCARCNGPNGSTYEVYLSDLTSMGVNYFQADYLHTTSGRFRVDTGAGGMCKYVDYVDNTGKPVYKYAEKTPLVGVMSMRLVNPIDSVDLVGTGATAGPPMTWSTTDKNPAYIYWDVATVPEKAKR